MFNCRKYVARDGDFAPRTTACRFDTNVSYKRLPTIAMPLRSQIVGLLMLWVSSPLCGGDIRFNEQIRPILAENCLHCHGPDTGHREGGLRLDTEEGAKASAIVAGDSDNSPFMHRITSPDSDERMPPLESGKSLRGEEVELLRRWIEAGASYQGHWAFEPIIASEPPTTQAAVKSEIDRFIVAKLEANGLTLSQKFRDISSFVAPRST
ncbi:MAG: c-type cytochrome domain-containing protein [Pirellulaceae bacterium]